MTTVHVIVKGLVQGVCFRDYTRREAEKYNVTGWVRNLPDGTVETVMQGEPGQVSSMLEWLKTGSPHSQVDNLNISDQESSERYTSFRIIF